MLMKMYKEVKKNSVKIVFNGSTEHILISISYF